MDEKALYVYGITWPDALRGVLGPGVDPRFGLELIADGPLAALASRVGFDQFDLSKLQAGSADAQWLSRVALRHNAIVQQAAQRQPVLPLRMGVLFRSRRSLVQTLAKHRPAATDFLRRLGDRQEWAAKVYLDAARAEQAIAGSARAGPEASSSAAGVGVQYLVRRRQREEARRAARQRCQREIQAAEAALASKADDFRRARILPSALTGRREKMLWNAAFLVAPASCRTWLNLADCVARTLVDQGLLLEVTGPWPAYHFCPELT